MTRTPGFCGNTARCATASARTLVWVELDEEFRCSACGGALVAPAAADARPNRQPLYVMAGLAGGFLLVTAAAAFVGTKLFAGHAPPPLPLHEAAPTQAAPLRAAAPPPVANSVITTPAPAAVPPLVVPPAAAIAPKAPAATRTAETGQAQKVAPTPQPATPAAPVVAAAKVAVTPAVVPPPPVVPDQNFNPRALTGGAPIYPPAMAVDGRAGEVTVECTITVDGHPRGCSALSNTGGRIFATSAMAWLRTGNVTYAPIVHDGHAVARTVRWTIRVEETPAELKAARDAAASKAQAAKAAADAAATAKPVPVPQPAPAQAAPAPAATALAPVASANAADRPFVARPLTASSPDYPDDYAEQGITGRVTVNCLIEPSGAPTGCQAVNVAGGPAFGRAVLTWLRGGSVRFAPIIKGGIPVAETHQWVIAVRP